MKIISSTATPEVATEFRMEAGAERMVAANGEINASSKKDLLQQQLRLMTAASEGRVMAEDTALERQKMVARNRELIQAAMTDSNARKVLGEKMADSLYMTSNRSGYTRRFLANIPLKQGEIPRFPVRRKNARAFVMAGKDRLETQVLTDKWYMPPEVILAARILVPQIEINQSNTDVLAEKHVEGLEALMVTEDRMLYQAFQDSVGVDNERAYISGQMTVQTFMNVRQNVDRWGIRPEYALLASDLFVDIVSENSFINAIEPVARHEIVLTGRIGQLYGMEMIAESYRHPEHKVLAQGELFVLGDSTYLGAYSDRGGVDSQPIDATTDKIFGKGWLFQESFAMALANARGVAAAKRV